uniref:SH3 domain containing GRB2 like 1, endophilin A2 n=1 Tax=Sinocyclocheilus grahami TaxID=75366 RepID=A0A672KJ83_SINGR
MRMHILHMLFLIKVNFNHYRQIQTLIHELMCDCVQKVDVTSRAVLDIMIKTTEYLQPNPASRARLSMINTMSKIRGQEKGPGYPQAETVLADAMLKFGRELGEESCFGLALLDAGESMHELGEVKDALDITVKQNFIDPLQNLHDKDLREIQHHLKKMEGRRLDFDYKKKRQGKVMDDELKQALEKFDESKEIAEQSMFNLLENDVRRCINYHSYFKSAYTTAQNFGIGESCNEMSNKPRKEYIPKPRMELQLPTPLDQPCCRALYDFKPENEGELGFKEGDIITLTNQIDDNWYEGMIHGQSGFFPINYVDILVPLPH